MAALQNTPSTSSSGTAAVEFAIRGSPSARNPFTSELPSAPLLVAASMDETMVVAGVGTVLDSMVQLANRGKPPHSMTCFHSSRAPNISVTEYLARMQRFLGCSTECYILGVLYIDRLIKRRPWIAVTALSCHRLVLCSLVLAAKFQDDKFYSNDFYARVGGLRLQELNALEINFMKLLDWQVHTMPEEYEFYRDLVYRAAVGQTT